MIIIPIPPNATCEQRYRAMRHALSGTEFPLVIEMPIYPNVTFNSVFDIPQADMKVGDDYVVKYVVELQ